MPAKINKLFNITDLSSIWNVKLVNQENVHNKLHVESNPVLTEVFNMTRTVPIVVDVKKMVQKYVGVDLQNWWRWSLQEMFGEGVKSYMTYIHPEDLVIHEKVNHFILQVLTECSYEEKLNLKSILNFRLKKSNGEYVHIMQLNRILELDSEGNPETFLVLLHEVSSIGDFPKRYIRLYGIPYYEKLYEYHLSAQTIMEFKLPTQREKEIMGYLVAGHDSQEIADLLFISKHTIDTHRRRILQKFHLKNTQELTYFASIIRLLEDY